MAKVELKMPKMGESITEATILKWLKEVGEEVEQEESVLEIATDKIDSEVPSPIEGKLLEILYPEGEVVPIGTAIALIEVVGDEPSNGSNGHSPGQEDLDVKVPHVPEAVAVSAVASGERVSPTTESRFYSPLVQNIAKEEGISLQELHQVPGTGRKGRVTKKDILRYLKDRKSLPLQESATPSISPSLPVSPTIHSSPAAPPQPGLKERTFSHQGSYEIEEMDRMRRMIADNMLYSQQISAHVTSFVEADVTSMVLWRNKVKQEFLDTFNEKITFTPLFVQAVCKVLRELPRLNASVQGDKILLKKDIHMGVAVALPSDNLIVPVVRHADKMNLAGLTTAINDLATRARKNKLKPEELEGGTYTISNVGTFGNVMGTPIIMQPQVGILATGAIRKIPAIVETPHGDVIGIRHKMFLSHSYDHRIIDGALGGKFVRRVADYLETWDLNQGL